MARDDPPGSRSGPALIAWLEEQGERKRANDLRTILRSLSTSRANNSVLHRDNAQLRREIERMERET